MNRPNMISKLAQAHAMTEMFKAEQEMMASDMAELLLARERKTFADFDNNKAAIMTYLIKEKGYRFSQLNQDNDDNGQCKHEALFVVTDADYTEVKLARAVIMNCTDVTISAAEIEVGDDLLDDLRIRAAVREGKLH
jgi:hypothetical protein